MRRLMLFYPAYHEELLKWSAHQSQLGISLPDEAFARGTIYNNVVFRLTDKSDVQHELVIEAIATLLRQAMGYIEQLCLA